ncbi:MAG: lipopolysaccharide biosynthesis protein [Gemmatimonadetes bacterium]|nr:lipopolysaccharide biosynthesis protein [Gemmatimonadota bacterium]
MIRARLLQRRGDARRLARAAAIPGGAADAGDSAVPALRRLASQVAAVFTANALASAVALIQMVLIARALGVRAYGLLAITITMVTVVNQLTSFRMAEFVVRYVAAAFEHRRVDEAAAALKFAFAAEAGASAVAYLLIAALAPVGAALFLHSPDGAWMVRTYAVVVLANVIGESSAGVHQAFAEFHRYSRTLVAGRLLSLAVVGAAFVLRAGMAGMIAALAIGAFLQALPLVVGALSLARRKLGARWWRVPVGRVAGGVRGAWRFTLGTNASSTLSLLARDADPLWLGYFRGPVETAYYKVALTVVTTALTPVGPLAQTTFPTFVRRIAARDRAGARRLIRHATAMAAAYILPASLVAATVGGPAIRLAYGRGFEPAQAAVWVLLGGLGFANLLFWTRPVLLALDRVDYTLKVNVGVAVSKLALVAVVIPRFGFVGNAALLAVLLVLGLSVSARKALSLLGGSGADPA